MGLSLKKIVKGLASGGIPGAIGAGFSGSGGSGGGGDTGTALDAATTALGSTGLGYTGGLAGAAGKAAGIPGVGTGLEQLGGMGETGGLVGAAMGGLGEAASGGLGGLGGGLGWLQKLLGADPATEQQFQRYTPEQQEILNQLMTEGMGGLGLEGSEELARKRFEETTIPSIAERFTSMGAGGQRSSAFQGALGRAGSDLEAQMKAQRDQQAFGKLGLGLGQRFDTLFSPQGQSPLKGLGGNLMTMLPMILKLLSSGG